MSEHPRIGRKTAHQLAAAGIGTASAVLVTIALLAYLDHTGMAKFLAACLLPLPFIFWQHPGAILESKFGTLVILAGLLALVAIGVKGYQTSDTEEPDPTAGRSGIDALFEDQNRQIARDKIGAQLQVERSSAPAR